MKCFLLPLLSLLMVPLYAQESEATQGEHVTWHLKAEVPFKPNISNLTTLEKIKQADIPETEFISAKVRAIDAAVDLSDGSWTTDQINAHWKLPAALREERMRVFKKSHPDADETNALIVFSFIDWYTPRFINEETDPNAVIVVNEEIIEDFLKDTQIERWMPRSHGQIVDALDGPKAHSY